MIVIQMVDISFCNRSLRICLRLSLSLQLHQCEGLGSNEAKWDFDQKSNGEIRDNLSYCILKKYNFKSINLNFQQRCH